MPAARSVGLRAAGFTIIELLITVAIVSILASAALPMAEMTVRRTREQDLRQSLREIRVALDKHKQAWDSGHILKKSGDSGYPRTLEVLVEGVVDAKSPTGAKIYFLRRLPHDPFAATANVPAGSTWGKRSYASPPDDPKEGDDVFDVYSLSDGIGMNGVPYREW